MAFIDGEQMDLESYVRASSGWLVDITTTFDLASAAELAVRPNWSPPADGSAVEGPYLISMRHPLPFAAALPFGVRSSREAMRAAWVACGHTPETANTNGVKVPFSNGSSPRIEGVLARAGIIAQFELWKSYATQFPGYPTNLKAAKKHSFVYPDEERLVTNLISIRNRMTHEIDVTNDPTARMLVDYTWECQHIAKWLTQLYLP